MMSGWTRVERQSVRVVVFIFLEAPQWTCLALDDADFNFAIDELSLINALSRPTTSFPCNQPSQDVFARHTAPTEHSEVKLHWQTPKFVSLCEPRVRSSSGGTGPCGTKRTQVVGNLGRIPEQKRQTGRRECGLASCLAGEGEGGM